MSTTQNNCCVIALLTLLNPVLAITNKVILLKGEPKGTEARLIRDLMDGHEARAIPRPAPKQPVIVDVDYNLVQIESLLQKEQILISHAGILLTWFDTNLKWNKTLYDDIDFIELYPFDIWTPQIKISNSVEETADITRKKNSVTAGTYNDGFVLFSIHGKFHTSCTLTLRKFPFDTQSCTLTFVHMFRPNVTYGNRRIYAGVKFSFPRGVSLTKSLYMENSEWEVTNVRHHVYEIDSNDLHESLDVFYPTFDITIDLKRRPRYYVVTLIIPLIWTSLISICGFLLPTESGERISLQITVYLSYMFFLLVLIDVLPPTANGFPIIAEFIIACQLFTTLNLFLTIVAIRIFYKEPSIPVPRWLGYLSWKMLRHMSFFKEKVIIQNGKVNEKKIYNNVRVKDAHDNNPQIEQKQPDYTNDWKSIARIMDGFCVSVSPICMLVVALCLFLVYHFS